MGSKQLSHIEAKFNRFKCLLTCTENADSVANVMCIVCNIVLSGLANCELTSQKQEGAELRLLQQPRRYFQRLLRKLAALYFPLLPFLSPTSTSTQSAGTQAMRIMIL